MGIRIHRAMGYGLTDVKHNGYHIDDDRFHYENTLNAIYDNKEFTIENFLRWVETNKSYRDGDYSYTIASFMANSRLKDKHSKIDDWDLKSCFVYQGEYGIPEVFMVIPPMHAHSWHRRADDMDWTYATYGPETEVVGRQTNFYREIPWGIFPWSDLFEDSETGNRFIKDKYDTARMFMQFAHNPDAHFKPDASEESLVKILDSLAQILGYDDHVEAKGRIKAITPEVIDMFCEWAGIFENPSTVHSLKPMILTYWS